MAMAMSQLLSTDNPVFNAFAFYSAVLVVKMFVMVVLTARQRFIKKVFANPEDAKNHKGKVKFDDPDVERVRRAHLNDLENIPIFLITAFLYTLTNPSPALAINLFRTFTATRIVHTVVYAVWVVPQPARGIAFGVGLFTTFYMAVQVMMFFK